MSGCDLPAPDPHPHHGAFLFHTWAANQLPPRVRAAWGYRFVHAANRLLTDEFAVLSGLVERLDKADYRNRVARFRLERKRRRKWGLRVKPGERDPLKLPRPWSRPPLACPGCRCDREAKADCLASRFRFAYGLVTGTRLAMRYHALADTSPNDARDLMEFMRAATPSDPIAREAYGIIKAREDPLLVVSGQRTGQETAALRDAFALTAMAAVREWCGLTVKESAALVAPKFGISPSTLERRRHRLDREARDGSLAE